MKLKLILIPLTLLHASILDLPSTGLAEAKKPSTAEATAGKPNILVIFGDDIGQTNVSAYWMARWSRT
jgi:arylsulfatase